MVSYEQTHRHCSRCGGPTIHYRKATNHVLHLLLTLVLCGWWAIVWLMVSLKIGGWRCQTCGASAFLPKLIGGTVAVVGLAVTGLVIFGAMLDTPPSPVRPTPASSSRVTPELAPSSPIELDAELPSETPALASPIVEAAAVEPEAVPEPIQQSADPVSPIQPEVESLPEAKPGRTWTDASGKFTIEAEFAGYSAGKVRLKKADGSTLTLPMEKLSQVDQEWILAKKR